MKSRARNYRCRKLLTILLVLAGIPGLAGAGDYPDTVAGCHLLDFPSLLLKPELQTDSRQPPEQAYRRLLTRFVALHYNKVARDILQGEGEYLNTLNHLLGTRQTDTQSCQQLFKTMLLTSPGPGGFTQALLVQRLPRETSADAAARPEAEQATTYPDRH